MITLKDVEYLKDRSFWSNEDVELSLKYLNENPEAKSNLIDAIHTKYQAVEDFCNDEYSLTTCIESGEASSFRQFDSDVLEQYIGLFIEITLDDGIMSEDGRIRISRDYKNWLNNLMTVYEQEPDDLTEDEIKALRNNNYIE